MKEAVLQAKIQMEPVRAAAVMKQQNAVLTVRKTVMEDADGQRIKNLL